MWVVGGGWVYRANTKISSLLTAELVNCDDLVTQINQITLNTFDFVLHVAHRS